MKFHDNEIYAGLYPRQGRVRTGITSLANAVAKYWSALKGFRAPLLDKVIRSAAMGGIAVQCFEKLHLRLDVAEPVGNLHFGRVTGYGFPFAKTLGFSDNACSHFRPR